MFLLVIAFGAVGAYVGDVITYAALRWAGAPLAQRVGWLHEGNPAEALERLRRGVEEHEVPVLLTSRLVPGGRVPVLLAAALGGYPWTRFAVANVAAAALWAAVYAAIGLTGRSVFPRPWQAALAAVVLVVALSLAGSWWQRRRRAAERSTSTQ
jgi:membrane protein DedA with SNARE-associated domain